MEITDVFTEDGINRIKTGQILIFENNGKKRELKVTRKSNGRIWAKYTKTYAAKDLIIIEKKEKD